MVFTFIKGKLRRVMKYSLTELLELPLFLGMGRGELDEIQKYVRLASAHVKKTRMIVTAGELCDSLIIVAKGQLSCIRYSDDKSYYMDEHLQAPLVIQPEHIFGMKQRYTMSFKSRSYCDVLRIEKHMVLRLMEKSMTFRLNFLNIITTQTQRLCSDIWHPMPEDIEKRIIRFVKDHSHYPAGCKILHIKMNAFAKELGCSRLEISEALHSLQDKQLLLIRRSFIEVPMLQLLIKQK